MILCNEITNADESFIEDNWEIFNSTCSDCRGSGKINGTNDENAEDCLECGGNGDFETEVYQYFIVDVNEYEKERLASFGVELGYSKALELHVLPIYDFGTSWSAFSYSKQVADDYELERDETLKR